MTDGTTTWPELAIGLYDRLTGRNAEIQYDFEDLQLDVPSRAGQDPEFARWAVSGTVRITTRDNG